MATTKFVQHPCHEHPLAIQEVSIESSAPYCDLCHRKISSAEAYTCQEGCNTYYHCYHRSCVEAPPQIDRHPLHTKHPLTLIHNRPTFLCAACCEYFLSGGSFYRCDECDFSLDICCALSNLSDDGGSQGGNTSEQITLTLHDHKLTSFSTRHDFVGDRDCYTCRGSVEGDGYMCLDRWCEFVIHKRCIQDLYYADGTKAPRVYHGHPLEVLAGEDTGSYTCASCGLDKSGEFIGCTCCQVFYHRHCFQVPEIIRYPNHTLVLLFPEIDTQLLCQSCSSSIENEIYYRCTSSEFFVHIGCAIQVLGYCEEGMSAKIELSWHRHPLLLCHRTESSWNNCICCWDKSIGPTYACEEKDCRFLLHKRCTEIESTITHPHHPDHPLTLCEIDNYDNSTTCGACGFIPRGLKFSCKRCLFDLDVDCAVLFPTHKHYLHEHKLLRFEEYQYLECNRCDRSPRSPLFRCVPCNFNLHEECMELPQLVKSKIHWHPLTLHETFVEDDSGEYYCEECEKTRDPRLGAYVCGQCKMRSHPRIYHIECVLPELRRVYEEKRPAVHKLKKAIADKREEVHTMKEEVRTMNEKIEEATQELDELVYQLSIILQGEREDILMKQRSIKLEGESEDES